MIDQLCSKSNRVSNYDKHGTINILFFILVPLLKSQLFCTQIPLTIFIIQVTYVTSITKPSMLKNYEVRTLNNNNRCRRWYSNSSKECIQLSDLEADNTKPGLLSIVVSLSVTIEEIGNRVSAIMADVKIEQHINLKFLVKLK